jgi:exodeoxyribonuclease VII large subunit
MVQPSFLQPMSITVTDVTRYLRQLLESDDLLQDVWIIGEISNLSRPSSGHIYFTLKDSACSLRGVIWKTNALRLRSPLQNGQAVEVHGSIGVYERDGQYQIYVDAVRPAGQGYLYQEFMRLKARLEAEGLFDSERKRPIPARPRKIGIVTSPTGAALQDMLNTLQRRYPLAEVILAPAAVQGEDAPVALIAALRALNTLVHPDVILLARGGGSLEDLWAFNDEWVVRAVASSEAPVICGVGHETDFTLCDFAADLRAPTPTGAAVLAVPEIDELVIELTDTTSRLAAAFEAVLSQQRLQLEDTHRRLDWVSPLRRIENDLQRLDGLALRMQRAFEHDLKLKRAHGQGLENRLAALSPQAVLKRGYAVVRRRDGVILHSTQQVQRGETVNVRLSEGSFDATIDDIQI